MLAIWWLIKARNLVPYSNNKKSTKSRWTPGGLLIQFQKSIHKSMGCLWRAEKQKYYVATTLLQGKIYQKYQSAHGLYP